MNEQRSRAVGHEDALQLHRFHRHEPYRRALYRSTDCFAIQRVALATLDIGLHHIGRRMSRTSCPIAATCELNDALFPTLHPDQADSSYEKRGRCNRFTSTVLPVSRPGPIRLVVILVLNAPLAASGDGPAS